MAMGEPIYSKRELAISRSKSNSQSHHRINRSHRTYSFTFLPFRVNISNSLMYVSVLLASMGPALSPSRGYEPNAESAGEMMGSTPSMCQRL